MKKTLVAKFGVAFALIAGVASAQTSVKDNETDLVGSDTLNRVVLQVLAANPSLNFVYRDLGSSQGERQLRGNVNAGEPGCVIGSGSPNPGCQEIAPMSRALGPDICNATENPENVNAEQLAICDDALVVGTNNAGHCAGVTNSNNDDGAGGYQDGISPPGNLGTNWRNILRMIYTGCPATTGNAAVDVCVTGASAIPASTRCNSAERNTLVSNWSNIVQGCATGVCPAGLRQAYRRDDSSGTTGVFLGFLGVANTTAVLANRTALTNISGAINAAPDNVAFCDRGQNEGFYPSPGSTVSPTPIASGSIIFSGDPIRKNCLPEDDLCAFDGRSGVVRAVRSGPSNTELPQAAHFPTIQCTRGAFGLVQYISSSNPVCPDGRAPISGSCYMPYYNDPVTGKRNYNCLNTFNSRPPGAEPTFDGRIYNAFARPGEPGNPAGQCLAAGEPDPACGKHYEISARNPQISTWRTNSAVLNTGIGGASGGVVPAACADDNATINIGCLLSKTTCAVGFAGREAFAEQAGDFDDLQEPLAINGLSAAIELPANAGYSLKRELFLTAIGGFDNITTQCLAAGRTADFCADEVAFADIFAANGSEARAACTDNGFIAKAAVNCRGAFETAGCGRTNATATCNPN